MSKIRDNSSQEPRPSYEVKETDDVTQTQEKKSPGNFVLIDKKGSAGLTEAGNWAQVCLLLEIKHETQKQQLPSHMGAPPPPASLLWPFTIYANVLPEVSPDWLKSTILW